MGDMNKAIAPKSDQINAEDLFGGPLTITIREMRVHDRKEQPIEVFFENDEGKPFRPCKSVGKLMVHAWGPESKEYIGRSMTLFRDPNVTWAGMKVGGIRVSHMSHVAADFVLALRKNKRESETHTVKKLVIPTKKAENQGLTQQPTEIEIANAQNLAKDAARGGSEAFNKFWNSDAGKKVRELVRPILDEIKLIIADPTHGLESENENPLSDRPTQEEIEAAERAALGQNPNLDDERI